VNCWRCGRKDLRETLHLLLNCTKAQLATALKELPRGASTPQKPVSGIEPGILKLPRGLMGLGKPHIAYLKDRGYTRAEIDELVYQWGLQATGPVAKHRKINMAWRLFIPFMYNDKVVSWTTRSIMRTVKQRYLTASKADEVYFHKHLLYGSDWVSRFKPIVVVEGIFDVWRIGRGAVALFGTRWSREQVLAIARHPIRYICLDQGAEKYQQKLIQELSFMEGETYGITLNAKDPDTAKRKEIRRIQELLS